jgi:hypothetical protein
MRKRMTEAEWLACSDSVAMLKPCRRIIREQPRKGRLFAVACCHRIWHLLIDRRSREAVKAAAAHADSLPNDDKLAIAAKSAEAAHADAFRRKGKVGASAEWAAEFSAHSDAWFAASSASNFAYVAAGDPVSEAGPEKAAQAELIRCIFGPLPFRTVDIDRRWLAWNNRAVERLAHNVYGEPDFSQLPLLANLLEEAGCSNADILAHCRQSGSHVPGCWVIDLLLGKS